MCIAVVAYNAHPRWRLVLAANRDEYHARPAASLARWDDGSGIIAGRDLVSGGTWAGLAPGRLVLVTNYRVPGYPEPHRPSRGALVTALLTGADPETADLAPYNPCNLFVATPDVLWFLGNHPQTRRLRLAPGLHGLSNGDFARPWAKTRQLEADVARWLAGPADDTQALFAALAAETPRSVQSRWDPHAGEVEPRLSPVFIRDASYGTRCSTVLMLDAEGKGVITERGFAPDGSVSGEVSLALP